MFTRGDGAWITRQTIARGFIPAQMAGHACAMAAELPSGGPPSGTPVLLDIAPELTAPSAGSVHVCPS